MECDELSLNFTKRYRVEQLKQTHTVFNGFRYVFTKTFCFIYFSLTRIILTI